MRKIFVTAFFILAVFVFVRAVEALAIADDWIISKPYTGKPKTDPKPKRKQDEISVDNKNYREQYYTPLEKESGEKIWIPNDNLKKLCQTGGCDLNTILAKYQPKGQSKFIRYTVKGPDDPYAGRAGTSGNEYISNETQEGVSGFYVAPNGRWYPISVPPPPRNPNEPYSAEPNPTTPPEQVVVIMTLTPTPTPYLGPWAKPARR
jgi:hypothetical protein